ncbi:cilia- and flagella-associated protein 251-like [Pogonomyrmex barbatus]|uniref:Cilia- and flagella-associated protein 251-like n=1 Tax=Pogonomyrmex barbatus TaxID=144034 RepID=A0A6I9WU75_9HYME|nr:cilia- and flagella-associated protein 251-like [Pogonomyrmex barbatus]
MNVKALEEIKNMKEGVRIESDHVLLKVELKGADRKKERRSNTIEKKELEEKVKKSITKVKKKIALWKIERRTWHSKEWNKKKRELRKELGRLKRGKISREEFVQKRKEYREWYKKEKRKHEREKEERIAISNKDRRRGMEIHKQIQKEERRDKRKYRDRKVDHALHGTIGSKDKIIMKEEEEEKETEKEEQEREEEKNELTREEIIKQLIELKKGKAPGENEIENEAWRLMPKEIRETFAAKQDMERRRHTARMEQRPNKPNI